MAISDRRSSAYAAATSAYERARLKRALVGGWPALGVVLAAAALERPLIVAFAVVALVVALLHVGGGWARGVWPGLVVGAVPFAAPFLLKPIAACASSTCASACVPVCVAAGLVAGAVCGLVAHREPTRAAASVAVAALVGSLGCAALGSGAVLGMALALAAAAAVPVMAARRA